VFKTRHIIASFNLSKGLKQGFSMPLKRGHFELRVLEGSQPGLGHHAITTLLQETGSNTGSLIELASRDFLDVIVPLRVRQTKY